MSEANRGSSETFFKIPQTFVKVGEYQYLNFKNLDPSIHKEAIKGTILQLELKSFDQISIEEKEMLAILQQKVIANQR